MVTRLAQLLSNSFWRLMEQVEDGLDVWEGPRFGDRLHLPTSKMMSSRSSSSPDRRLRGHAEGGDGLPLLGLKGYE